MRTHLNKQTLSAIFAISFAWGFLFADNSVPTGAEALIRRAFLQRETKAVQQTFIQGIPQLKTIHEQTVSLTVLADYESLSGLYHDAAEHYKAAAFVKDPSGKTGRDLLIKAVRALLSAGEDADSRVLIEQLEASAPLSLQSEDYTLHVYRLWLDFRLGFEPLTRLRQYISNPHYAAFHPALLFTLWWFSNDDAAKKTLAGRFPNSIENAVIQGKAELMPNVFWYLMPRSSEFVTHFNKTTQTTSPLEKAAISPKQVSQTPLWHQTGFFQSETYAKRLCAELVRKGFSAIVRKEVRPNNSIYFAVLVKAEKNTVLRLKDAGYESVPVFE